MAARKKKDDVAPPEGPRYLGSAKFAELCRLAGLSNTQILDLTGWPPAHQAKIMAGDMPFIGGYFGEIRRLAPVLGVSAKDLWDLYDLDRANWKSKKAEDAGRPSEKR